MAWRALFRRSFADGRTRTLSFAALFFVATAMQIVGYENAYPGEAARAAFAQAFGNNAGIRIFYGVPHDLLTTGGYVSWRVGGTMAIFISVWGLLAGARIRAEEDAGRQELVLASPAGRGQVFNSFVCAVLAGATSIWFAGALAQILFGLPVGPSAYLAFADVLSGVVFAGVGVLCAQIAPNRRSAIALAAGVFGLAFLLRVVADIADGMGWLRWFSPMGWTEEMRAFVGARPEVALLPIAIAALLFFVAGRLNARRDIGTGILPAHDSRPPNRRLLTSPLALDFRLERVSLAVWLGAIGLYALLLGAIAHSVTAGLATQAQSAVQKLGAASLTAQAYIGLLFLLYVFAASLFICSQLAALRHEEAEGRLEILFAEPVGRVAWLGGRLFLALLGVAGIGLSAAVFSWVGAQLTGTSVGIEDMLEAGANCLPVGLLFLGIGALVFALAPRATSGVTYGLVSAAFVWWLFGSVLDVPTWTLDLSPFRHIALVPVEPFNVGAALVMSAIGAAAIAAALQLFRRRDLVGA